MMGRDDFGDNCMVIMKFGGTSVQDAHAIDRAASIVRSRLRQKPVVVVSALAKVTDQLVMIGQKASAGDAGAATELVAALKARHLQVANDLLGAEQSKTITPALEQLFADLDSFVRGVAAGPQPVGCSPFARIHHDYCHFAVRITERCGKKLTAAGRAGNPSRARLKEL